jgi:hypothetical protein
VGAIIGGIVGCGKGAGTGAAIGAGVGVLSGAAEADANTRARAYYDAPPPPPPGPGPRNLVFGIQSSLNHLGYDVGPPDGVMGPRTAQACSAGRPVHMGDEPIKTVLYHADACQDVPPSSAPAARRAAPWRTLPQDGGGIPAPAKHSCTDP